MLIVINSLPKCASSYTFFTVSKCLTRLGYENVFDIYPEYVNKSGNPGNLTYEKLRHLSEKHTVAIKAHFPFKKEFLPLIKDGRVKFICLIRHPVDIVLSALDYGKYQREFDQKTRAYYKIHTVEDALKFCGDFWYMHDTWKGNALILRYEDFQANNIESIQKIFQYCDLNRSKVEISQAIMSSLEELSVENIANGSSQYDADQLRLNLKTRGKRQTTANERNVLSIHRHLSAVIENLGY